TGELYDSAGKRRFQGFFEGFIEVIIYYFLSRYNAAIPCRGKDAPQSPPSSKEVELPLGRLDLQPPFGRACHLATAVDKIWRVFAESLRIRKKEALASPWVGPQDQAPTEWLCRTTPTVVSSGAATWGTQSRDSRDCSVVMSASYRPLVQEKSPVL
ncbi:hypothetical protein Tco_1251356, partial [Tanacetum coccineum]